MNRYQNERNRNPESPIPGCLGRMVNLFDLNTSLGANRLLTEKPHYEGSPVSRCQSDVSRTRIVEDRMKDKMSLSELAKSPSNRRSNVTPIKMLIAQEMSKEVGPKQSPPNLVAKLMGLDTLPESHSASYRSNQRGSRSLSGSLDFIQKDLEDDDESNQSSCKDVFEIWQQSPQKGGRRRHKSHNKESKNEKNMALVREKFMEAKRLSTDENLRQSKQFQDALEVLSSNKDLFLKFLQEPNSLFSQHHHHLHSSPPDSRRITVLKPSKLVDAHKLNKNGKQIQETHFKKLNDTDNNPSQPTRIVVLKPSSLKPQESKITPSNSPPSTSTNDDGFYGDLEEDTKETSHGGISSGHRRDENENETFLSSVFSNGYIGDESSFSKSEVYYAAGNLSDSEVMSPISRHSWDYINRFGSPYSSSSFSRASCSPESSVCREAKKRLSERWAMMSLNGSVQEQRHHVRRSSSTLGEMLALSDLKKSEEGSTSGLTKSQDVDDNGPKSLVRSKSVPVSSGSVLGEVSEPSKVKKDDTKEKSVKSSLFKGMFFSKSRKSSKKLQKDDECQSSRNIGDDESECVNDINGSLRKESCQSPTVELPEVGFSVKKPETCGNSNENQEQPSPNSVLELQFEDDEHTAGYSYSARFKEHGVDPIKFNLIDKSPPIGTISRTLSFDEFVVGPTTPVKTSSPEEEEEEYFLYVQTLLSVAGINGRSPENHHPLDPSLRDTYMNMNTSLTDNNLDRSKQRHQRLTQRLVFDCVNEALSGAHVDEVWDRMKGWISGGERCVWEGDGGGMAVERVVRREVVGRVWVEDLGVEIDDIKKEIEEKLMEEIVRDFILGCYTL